MCACVSMQLSSTESLLENESYVLQINPSSLIGYVHIYSTVKYCPSELSAVPATKDIVIIINIRDL